MKIFFNFSLLISASVIVILLLIILGDYGPWYLSWILGTGFMMLVSVLGAVYFEEQEQEQE
ncbi:TPA: cytochrome bd oxidase small subunit, CydX/CbdX family [Morganella morganii subsp. morganii]|nr:cytochrome bd oxidase small subunit, CydX/CbdX family [Morganella morganii subsp. morganii]